MVGQNKVSQALSGDMDLEQLLDFILFGYALAHLVQGNVEASQEAEFGMRGCQVIDDAQTVLLCNIGCLDACLFAYFAAYGCKGVRVCFICFTCYRCIEVAFKEATDDMVTPGIDVYALPFVEEDVAVSCFDDGAHCQRIAQLLAVASSSELGLSRCYVFFGTGVAKDEV